jgi:hypothetical protein
MTVLNEDPVMAADRRVEGGVLRVELEAARIAHRLAAKDRDEARAAIARLTGDLHAAQTRLHVVQAAHDSTHMALAEAQRALGEARAEIVRLWDSRDGAVKPPDGRGCARRRRRALAAAARAAEAPPTGGSAGEGVTVTDPNHTANPCSSRTNQDTNHE